MADAQATFAITFDTSALQAGAKASDSALERQAASIKRVSKDLDGLKAAQKRLLASASVKQYLAQQKAIETTQRKATNLEKKLSGAQEALGVAKQANVAPEDMTKLVADVDRYKASLEGAREELERLEKAQSKLSTGDDAVKAYKDKSSVIDKQEGSLADLQAQFDRAGGSAEDLAAETKGAKGGLDELLGASKGAGGGVGDLAKKLEKFKSMGAAGGLALVVAVLVAIAVAAAKAYVAMAKFGIAAADAARSAGIVKLATTGSAAGMKELDGAVEALRANTAASREEATQLASELYKVGLRGKGLEDAALTVERFGVLGEEAKGQIKSLYEQIQKPAMPGQTGMMITADMLPRDQFLQLAKQLGKDGNKALLQGFQARKSDVAAALKKIGDVRFGDAAIQQMMSLSKLAERGKENLEDLFKGIDMGPFLGALRKIVMVFDQSTSSGKALKKIAEVMLQPLLDIGAKLGPFFEGFFEGLTFGMLVVILYALKIRKAFNSMFPGSFLKNLDAAQVGFYAAGGVIGGITIALIALAAIIGLVAVALGLIALPFIAAGAAIYGVISLISAAFDALSQIDLFEAGSNIVKGLVAGIKAGVGSVVSAVQGLASSALSAFSGSKGIDAHSPSQAFRRRARMVGPGAGLGVEDNADDMGAAVEGMASGAAGSLAPPSGGGPTGGGGGGVTIRIEAGAIVIQGVKDADEMEGGPFLQKLAKAFASMSSQMGGPALEPAT